MADTNTSDQFALDREDPETLDQSTARQWNLIGHLLHLPPLTTIASVNQRNVATRIARFMSNMRTDIVDRVGLRNELQESFQDRLNAIQGIDQNAQPMRAALASANIPVAEAWLQTIYEHFGERELRAMTEALPASILPITPSGRWEGSVVLGPIPTPPLLPPPAQNIQIDLQHPIWRTGDQQAIAQRLLNRTPAQAGIVCGYNAPLTQPDIDAIFGSLSEVVDPLLPIGEIVLENVPQRGRRTMVNLAPIIRLRPEIANLNETNMIVEFLTDPNLGRMLARNVHIVNIRTAADIAFTNTSPQTDIIIRGIFAQLSRNPAQSFAARNVNLLTAIQTRQPIDRLLGGSATNREVLLALAMLQRNPNSAAILENQRDETVNLTTRKNITGILKQVAEFKAIPVPANVPADAANQRTLDIVTQLTVPLTNPITILEGAQAAWIATEIANRSSQQADASALAAWEADTKRYDKIIESNNNQTNSYQAAVAKTPVGGTPPAPPILIPLPTAPGARPVPTPLGTFPAVPIGVPFPGTIFSIEELRTKLTELRTALRDAENANSAFQERADLLMQLRAAMTRAQITDASIATLFPTFNTLIPATGINTNQLRGNMNWQPIIDEIKTNFPAGLKTFEEYTADIAAARTRSPQNGAVGSEACREVVRRGLEDEGMRGQELEDTLTYMFNSIERKGETVADLRMYAQREFPDGENDHDAEHHWEHGKSFRRFSTLGFSHSQPYHQYLRALSQPNNFGFNLMPRAHGVPAPDYNFQLRSLPNLLDTHFRLKALTELPESDPHHIPQAEHIVDFQRNLYEAIVDRAQKSFQRASGMTSPEFIEMRASGMSTTPDQFAQLSIGDRMQAVRVFLKDTPKYMSDTTNKTNFDRMVRRAYHHVEEDIERHNRWKTYLNPFGRPNISPITWPKAILWNAPKWTVQKGLQSPPAQVWKQNWRSGVVGGLIGAVALPGYGLPIGLAATPYAMWVYKKLIGESTGGAAASHDSHGAAGGHH